MAGFWIRRQLFSPQKAPVKITIIYSLTGGCWILFSDLLLSTLVSNPSLLMTLSIFKGWLYILITASLLYLLIKQDMLALQQSQEAIRLSEERYRSLFEEANDAILVVNEAGDYIDANRQAEALTGYSRSELLKLRFLDLIPEVKLEQGWALFQAFKQAGRQAGEQVITRKDGSQVHVEFSAAFVPPDRYQTILRDITTRKQIELKLRRQALIFRHLTDGVIVTDLEDRIVDWNPAAEKMFGYSKAEVLGQTVHLLHPAEEVFLQDEILDRIKEIGHWAGELHFVRKDGSVGICETLVIPLYDEQGRPVARIGVNRDLTEQKQLAAQLRQAQKMEAIGRMAGGVAHDFNNILTVMIGYSDFLLTTQLQAGSPAYHEVEQIRRAAERAAGLTRHLLAFSRQQLLQPVRVNLNSIITDLEKMLRRVIGEDIELITVLDSALDWVKVDPTQMEQVIINLAVNARDAMPQGGRLIIETANIALDETYARYHVGSQPGPHILLTVTDTGHGMDADTQAKIFEPFFTTKERDQGTGLGLSTVYGIVKQSGGHLKVYSEPGWGTTFKIYLPQSVTGDETLPSPPIQIHSLHGRETILLVEDEAGVRELIQTILAEYGYTVLAVSRGSEAVRLSEAYARPIHLLLTDVVLPGLNGSALAERLIQVHPQLKVIYMSGYPGHVVIQNGALPPNQTFIQKPFSPTTLARKIRELLD